MCQVRKIWLEKSPDNDLTYLDYFDKILFAFTKNAG